MVVLNDLLIDTVALVRYLEDNLPREADAAFTAGERGKARLLLPAIALGEFYYVALRGRVTALESRAEVEEAVQHILGSSFIAISAMPAEGWDNFMRLEVPELHDRMIAAEAIARGIPLISNDPAFKRVHDLSLIW